MTTLKPINLSNVDHRTRRIMKLLRGERADITLCLLHEAICVTLTTLGIEPDTENFQQFEKTFVSDVTRRLRSMQPHRSRPPRRCWEAEADQAMLPFTRW